MINKAFNISFEEKDFYPTDCKIDTSLDKDIMDFFKSQKTEEDKYYLSKKTKNKKVEEEISKNIVNFESKEKKPKKQNEIINNNEDGDEFDEYIENEEGEENEDDESSSSSELIYSNFPDNIELTKKNIYEKMNINKKLIEAVIEEFSKTKNKFLNEYKKEENENNLNKNDKLIIDHKEFNKYELPDDNIINNKILPFKSNEYLMKNINKCFKVLKNCNKSNKKELGKVSEWLYTFFLFLEMPLSPDFNADLYSINKYIYNNFMKISELKIIFIIICEIFKQILIV